MGKNVAVFVDVANIFYAAKAAGVDIDYVTLLKSASAGRDLVRAYAYTGLDPDNENQRNFHDFLRRSNYKVVSKDIRKYGDGKVKANLDIELVVDMMKTARNLDIAIVVSGDGDFAPAIRAVQEQGVRVEVLSFRGNTSSDLMEVADLFTDIAQIAKVEKGSSRSGRRVASDEDDLSMTEVPDKMSEGTGTGRGRGRSRSRVKPADAEPVAAPPRRRSRAQTPVETEAVQSSAGSGSSLVALPGEKLSKAAPVVVAPPVTERDADDAEESSEEIDEETRVEGEEEPRRRRRRRGGRGRGRGRGHEDGVAGPDGSTDDAEAEPDDTEADEPPVAPGPARRSTHAFGSVWDSQIGMPAAASGTPGPIDEEDLDEPPIPEYLISERRQRDSGRGPGRGGPARGGARAGYAAASDRERFGPGNRGVSGGAMGGRSGGGSRYSEPSPRGGSREPDRFRTDRPAPRSAGPVGNPNEPWTEVPPELEAMLRAQLGSRPVSRPAAPSPASGNGDSGSVPVEATKPAPRRRSPRAAVVSGSAPEAPMADVAEVTDTTKPAPKARPSRKAPAKAAATKAPAKVSATRSKAKAAATPSSGDASASAEPVAEKPAPKRRTTRKTAAVAEPEAAKPTAKRRTTRKAAEPAS